MTKGEFRYNGRRGTWLKGNTHLHTTRSDGGKSPDEVAAMYAGAGFDFICLTDHWHASAEQGTRARGTELTIIDGIELDGDDEQGSFYHIVCLGTLRGLDREMGLGRALSSAREQGAFLVLAHPLWTGNTVEQALRHPFHGVEAYNHVCQWLNGKGSGLAHWEAVLEERPEVVGLSVDDAHIRAEHPGWNGGWVMASAADRSPRAILDSLRAGTFYSSTGPEIHSMEWTGRSVICRCSPVSFARLVGPRHRGQRVGSFDGATMTEVELALPEDWAHARLELEDSCGRRAWTNTLFV
jgi:hypothetical protein